jgi:hypothetical protein
VADYLSREYANQFLAVKKLKVFLCSNFSKMPPRSRANLPFGISNSNK